ncbi:hypothetical protein [Flavobacterium sp. '19STA2R22 D10 B1']|uniref:hypothetical protein n=1 Tax=Flavobacterium aerium TaxID=3037261 RepID=UPI00278C32F6|nr:hypothetical protein [Flavobacterium sp. '19STA2R22 D10 B1']
MKHKRNLFIILLLSIVLSVIVFFLSSDLIVSSTSAKIFEILFTVVIWFIILTILYIIKNILHITFKKATTKMSQKKPSV